LSTLAVATKPRRPSFNARAACSGKGLPDGKTAAGLGSNDAGGQRTSARRRSSPANPAMRPANLPGRRNFPKTTRIKEICLWNIE
jgi:hypothetical protein